MVSFSDQPPAIIGGTPSPPHTRSNSESSTTSTIGESKVSTDGNSTITVRSGHRRMPSTPYPRAQDDPLSFSFPRAGGEDKPGLVRRFVNHVRGVSKDNVEIEDVVTSPKLTMPRERKYGHSRSASARSVSYGGSGSVPWAGKEIVRDAALGMD